MSGIKRFILPLINSSLPSLLTHLTLTTLNRVVNKRSISATLFLWKTREKKLNSSFSALIKFKNQLKEVLTSYALNSCKNERMHFTAVKLEGVELSSFFRETKNYAYVNLGTLCILCYTSLS